MKRIGEVYSVAYEIEGKPDLPNQFTPDLVIRPEVVMITLRIEKGPWEFKEATVSGPRVLKNGKLGSSIHYNRFLHTERRHLPDWLNEMVDYELRRLH
jgi:hypothetical protein